MWQLHNGSRNEMRQEGEKVKKDFTKQTTNKQTGKQDLRMHHTRPVAPPPDIAGTRRWGATSAASGEIMFRNISQKNQNFVENHHDSKTTS